MLTLLLVTFVTIVLLFFLNYLYQHFRETQKSNHVPGENHVFPIKFLFQPESSPATTYNLKKDFKTHGSVYKHTIGTQTIYFLSNPEDFKKILVTDWKKFGKPPSITKNLMWEKKRSLFTSEPDDQWKRQRSLASPAFSDNSLQFEFETNIDKVTNDLIKFWDKVSVEKGEIDASNDFGLLTLDAIGISGFGQEFKAVENQDKTFSDIIDMIFSSARFKNLFPPFFQKLPIPLFKRIKENETTWKKYVGDIVDKRREELEKSDREGFAFDKTDLLSKMMNSHILDENPLEQEELYTNVHTFIAAGHETTANTLSWSFYFLAKNPKYQEMMYEEAIKEFGNDKVLSFEKLSKGFPFIKAFLHETLRLKNPAFAVVRYSLEDYQFGDYKIPKNSELILCLCNAASDEKIWGKDVDDFRPERFLEGKIDTRFMFTPFSMGPRVCIGRRFSEMEMILILAKAMMKFRISPTKDLENVKEKIAFTMRPSQAIKVNIKPFKP